MKIDFVDVMRSFYKKSERRGWTRKDLIYLRKYIVERLRGKKFLFLVAEVNNRILGYATGSIGKKDHRGRKHGEIDEIFVKKNFRGGMVGTVLLNHLIKAMKKLGVGDFEAEIAIGNERSKKLFRKFGFYEHSLIFVKKK